jgi:hypothetical protein
LADACTPNLARLVRYQIHLIQISCSADIFTDMV